MANSELSKIAILGAGAMGCYFAGKLIEGGAQVTLVDVSASRIADLNARGLTVIDHGGERTLPVTAVQAAGLQHSPDLIIVFTKSLHTYPAIASLAPRIGSQTWVLTLQNGLGNAEEIARMVSPERVLLGVTDVPADFQPPATVTSHGDGKIRFWDYQKTGPGVLARVEALLKRAGFATACDPLVETAVWEKVAFNSALNALTSVLRRPVGALNNSEGRELIGAVVSEAVEVATKNGVEIDRERIDSRLSFALAEHAEHQPSMLQDVLAGRQTEIDSINGAIVAAGRKAGVATPVNAALVKLVKLQAKPG